MIYFANTSVGSNPKEEEWGSLKKIPFPRLSVFLEQPLITKVPFTKCTSLARRSNTSLARLTLNSWIIMIAQFLVSVGCLLRLRQANKAFKSSWLNVFISSKEAFVAIGRRLILAMKSFTIGWLKSGGDQSLDLCIRVAVAIHCRRDESDGGALLR